MTPLRQRMLEDMQLRNLSPQTQKHYVRSAVHRGESNLRMLFQQPQPGA